MAIITHRVNIEFYTTWIFFKKMPFTSAFTTEKMHTKEYRLVWLNTNIAFQETDNNSFSIWKLKNGFSIQVINMQYFYTAQSHKVWLASPHN